MTRRLIGLALVAILVSSCGVFGDDEASVTDVGGELADGATWRLQYPADEWNGTLLVYSHGLVPAGEENPAQFAPAPVVADALLDRGYALAGTSYARAGYVVEAAVQDQTALLDVVAEELRQPERTIAWGSSLGGLVTVALVEGQPERFDGGVSFCGVVAGSVGLWDTYLDVLFALEVLVAPDAGVELTSITDPAGSLAALTDALAAAQDTPEGRAQISLASTLGDIPTWIDLEAPRPDDGDLAARQAAQYGHLATYTQFGIEYRADMEGIAGGNPSTNLDVDYAALLEAAGARDLVQGLYQDAGLDLQADLQRLAQAPRITAEPGPRQYLSDHVTPTGALEVPLLNVHHTADFVAVVEHEQAYRSVVTDAGADDALRQTFVERPAHCLFAPAEMIAALETLDQRLDDGQWPDTDPDAMNDRADEVADGLDGDTTGLDPSFVDDEPGPFPRPFALP